MMTKPISIIWEIFMTAIECNGSNNIDVQEQATSLDRQGELGVYR